jgi:hypothetical protein
MVQMQWNGKPPEQPRPVAVSVTTSSPVVVSQPKTEVVKIKTPVDECTDMRTIRP